MSQRHVLIVSSRGLFREGLRHLLADVATVISATSPEEVEDLLRGRQVDIVILDQEDDPAVYDNFVLLLLSIPHMRVITVRLDVSDIQVYRREQVAHASPEALVAAVVG